MARPRQGLATRAPQLEGTRDEAERTLFDMILAGDIPSDKVYEDEACHAPSVVVMTTTDRQRGGPTYYYYNHLPRTSTD